MPKKPPQPLQNLAALALAISGELEKYHDHADVMLRFRLRKISIQAKKLAEAIDTIPRPKVAITKASVAPWWKRKWTEIKFRLGRVK